MAKKVTLVLPEQVYQHLLEIATATETTLSSTASTGIESLFWMRKQQEDGFTIKAEKQEKDKTIIKELSIA
ncbi:MAG: hypothetical protein ACM3WV_11015 [Bacillota bacterium]